MSRRNYIFAEGIPSAESDKSLDEAGPHTFDLLEAMLSGDCRRCGDPVDRRQASRDARIPFAIVQTGIGAQPAPICDDCARFLRGRT
jgi:hypothetical protein